MADDHMPDDETIESPRAGGDGVRITGPDEVAAHEAERQSRLAGAAAGATSDSDSDEPTLFATPSGGSAVIDAPTAGQPALGSPRPAPSSPGGAPPELPHWTDPPTGEVPRILPVDGDDGDGEDDLEAWSGLTSRQPRWREGNDWQEADFDDPAVLGDGGERMGALDENRAERDVFTFAGEGNGDGSDEDEGDEGNEDDIAPRVRTHSIRTRSADSDGQAPPAASDRNVPVAIAAGIALMALGLVAFGRGPGWAAALVTVVVVLCAIEVFDAFRRGGFRPATLLGLVASGSLVVGAYVRGERAIPLILGLAVIFSLLWHLFGAERARPTVNVAVTLLGVVWVGFLGSFAALLLRYPDREGIAFLLGTVLAVAANDVGALFVGRRLGHRPLAGDVSPNKSLEGWVGGLVVTLLMCVIVVRAISPWTFGSALALAVVVSFMGPLGDLCESMLKRDLGLKDMGNLLPGHGGLVDRFDSMLFVLPAVYYLVEALNLATG